MVDVRVSTVVGKSVPHAAAHVCSVMQGSSWTRMDERGCRGLTPTRLSIHTFQNVSTAIVDLDQQPDLVVHVGALPMI
jgi:hypothetical protein